MRWVVAVCVAVFGFTSAQAGDPEFERKQILELIAECQKKGHERAKRQIELSSVIRDAKPDKAGFFISTDTEEYRRLCAMHIEFVPRMVELLRELPDSQYAAKYYLGGALAKITRADPGRLRPVDPKQPQVRVSLTTSDSITDYWLDWWKGREETPKLFAAAAKKWAEVKEKEKGLLSITRRVLNDKTGKVEEMTVRTAFAEAHDDLLAFGLDAIPEVVERFEKKDYTLKPILDELTDHRHNLDEPLDWAVLRYVKWWRNPSESAESMHYQMPPVSAAKLK